MQVNDKSNRNLYSVSEHRYDTMMYRRCGESGVRLPAISLGLWHNFGAVDSLFNARNILRSAFNQGIIHFDLANNYGPPYGSAEETFGSIYKKDFIPYRNELFISTKAGYDMWPGPFGDFGSRKYLVSSLDDSLKRMGLDYVDLFYHHRPDPDTPLEETMTALDHIVRQGKALYVGVSNYPADLCQKAAHILRQLGTPCLIHQARYSMLDRWIEPDLLPVLEREGMGCIAYSPLEQGILTNRYLKGIPRSSRAAKEMTFLDKERVQETMPLVSRLAKVAESRGQDLAQMAISWLLKDPRITSVLIGASSVEQLDENIEAVTKTSFTVEECATIEDIIS